MNEALSDQLHKDFPLLFANGIYFACGDGWEPLIRKLAAKLEPVIAKKRKLHKDGWYRASQVKEKFGTLRFYLSSGTERMFKDVDSAEKASGRICEMCGKPGKTRSTNGWLLTTCGEKH